MEITPTEQLQQVEQEYQRKRAEIEQQMKEQGVTVEGAPTPSEHETLSQVVEGVIQEHVPEFKASSHAPKTGDLLEPEAQEKVQGWVTTTFNEGLSKGIKASKESNDIALIDAFHKALTGSLYEILIEQKKIVAVK